MKLFKEIMCEECGKKTNVLTRTQLADGAYLCNECSQIIPSYMLNLFFEKYTLDEFKIFKKFIDGENVDLNKKFSETHQYGSLHLDHINRLFYIDDYRQIIILKCKDIREYNIEFRPEKYEEGVLKDKAIGKVVFEYGA